MIKNGHRKISRDELERALRIIAEVISIHGDTYLPIFIRLRDELEQRKAHDAALEEALKLARDKQ